MRIFLCGDVMTGRGIDQILPHPCDSKLYEPYVGSALEYVRLAESRSGEIRRPVSFDYIWGDTLAVLRARAPDLRIINLETSITGDGVPEPKGINYRMNPRNVPCLTAFGADCCVLANNHAADWGAQSLIDTLDALSVAGIAIAGGGRDADRAASPATLAAKTGQRVHLFAVACPSSGTPAHWAATTDRPGINFLPDTSEASFDRIAGDIAARSAPDDLVMLSVHWGGNWGYQIADAHRAFAHALIDRAGVDIVFGHSSHHPKAVEVHKGRSIFYGCGDFLNDYEGIGGHEDYRPDLVLGYLLDIDARRKTLVRLEMLPFRLRKFRLQRASAEETSWLGDRMDRECRKFGSGVRRSGEGKLELVL
ncbi:MAG: CapA family protein [Dichotomicrobium sp.]